MRGEVGCQTPVVRIVGMSPSYTVVTPVDYTGERALSTVCYAREEQECCCLGTCERKR